MENQKTLGDYLEDEEPVAALWPDLVDAVFRDSPRVAQLGNLTPAAQTIFFVGCFEGEIINGGISQFFSNSSGNHTLETLNALRQIGADLSVSLLEKSLTLFPAGVAPSDRQKRCEILFEFEEREPEYLEDLTNIFYQQVDALGSDRKEDLNKLCLDFMKANSSTPVSI